MAKADRLQFCADDSDITSDFYAEEDATEVRVWDTEDCVLVAVSKNADGTWSYESSDYGPGSDTDTGAKYGSWREALDAFGYGDLA
ncbi:hypothetical protein ACT17_14685 [Mycolicibacterium conceptionense]|uniref:Uncharacterized protein n=1 Tax=Mycolicibacterium conceptionense TaxID=451644 RepID=A0A0J8U804_9MYCO|nr:hypothetical protein [Mycolicibacterium conceptionense]KMV17541.1 hypothetical protein ACT17_14685 [Mycolicibacterium conceptionense]